jgi:hypothetical protein
VTSDLQTAIGRRLRSAGTPAARAPYMQSSRTRNCKYGQNCGRYSERFDPDAPAFALSSPTLVLSTAAPEWSVKGFMQHGQSSSVRQAAAGPTRDKLGKKEACQVQDQPSGSLFDSQVVCLALCQHRTCPAGFQRCAVRCPRAQVNHPCKMRYFGTGYSRSLFVTLRYGSIGCVFDLCDTGLLGCLT